MKKIRKKDVGKYTNKIVDFLEGAAISVGKLVFDLVLIVVLSIYMLLGMPRLAAGDRPAVPVQTGLRPLARADEQGRRRATSAVRCSCR